MRIPLSGLGLIFLGALVFVPHGFDFYAYWIVDPFDPYAVTTEYGAFRYAPPVALLFAPLGSLPLPVAQAVWLGLQLGCLWYIARGWALALVVFPPVWVDLAYGNVYILFAAMIVAGYRHPAVWAFGLLTKITPGVGLVWFAVRREWRALGAIAIVSLASLGVSLIVQGPDVWPAWIASLVERASFTTDREIPLPLVPRVVGAALLVAWGGVTDRRWTVPAAVCIAAPTLWFAALWLAPLVATFSPTALRGLVSHLEDDLVVGGPRPRRSLGHHEGRARERDAYGRRRAGVGGRDVEGAGARIVEDD